MTDTQNSYLKMLEFVSEVMEKDAPVWSGNATCVAYKAELDAAIAGMYAANAAQMSKPSKAAKAAARASLSAAAGFIAKGLSAYASVISDDELLAQAKLPTRTLTLATGLALLGIAQRIGGLAEGHIGALGPYNITQAVIDDAAAKADAFSALIGSPAAAIRQRAKSTAALEAARKEGVAACRKLDLIIPIFEEAAPAFTAAFAAARRVPKAGRRRRALQVRVTTPEGTPIAGATIRIVAKKLKRKTGAKGQAYIQHLPPGEYMLHIEAEGHAPAERKIYINAGERTLADVALTAA